MDDRTLNREPQLIDVDNVLKSKNPALYRIMPGFIIRYLKRIIHQDELNRFLKNWGHLQNREIISEWLKFLGISYKVHGRENIPSEGRFIFASNHPLGGLDGLVFIYEISKYFGEVKFPVNDILMNIENLSGVFLPVNKHGSQAREAVKMIDDAYASSCQILYFPAGLCSRKKKGVIKDLEWQKSFITKAVEYKRDIIPVFFSGRNSSFFYNLANLRTLLRIKANIEMIYLPDEMFRQKDKDIHMVIGQKISWKTFDRSKTPGAWAEWVKNRSYELETLIR
jgi:1-acyl-sn-glycerol-3-phosphate acyltransferase